VIPLLYPEQDWGRLWHKEEENDCIVFDSQNGSVYLQGERRRKRGWWTKDTWYMIFVVLKKYILMCDAGYWTCEGWWMITGVWYLIPDWVLCKTGMSDRVFA
jgi:hypothetical protein